MIPARIPRAPARPLAAALAVLALFCLLAGCGGDDGPDTLFRPLPRGDLPATGKTYGGTFLDADGDGWLDLLYSEHSNTAQLRLGGPAGFHAALLPRPLPPVVDHHGAAACDYDGDGDWDALVSMGAEHGSGQGLNGLWTQEGPGRFTDSAAGVQALNDPLGRGRGALWADFDGDRRPELMLLNYASPVRLLTRTDAGWQDATDRLPMPAPVMPWSPGRPLPDGKVRRRCTALHSAVAADLDEDGDSDLLVLGRVGQSAVWINDGAGRFWDATARCGLKPTLFPESPKHAAAGDLDGDGDLDLVLAHRRNPEIPPRRQPLEVWLNDPSAGIPRFTPATPSPDLAGTTDPLAVLLADLDNDGALDLYVVHTSTGAEAPNRLYRGDGQGGFAAAPAYWGGAGPAGGNPDSVWPVDLDRDGDLDLVTFNGEENTARQTGGVLCYENRGNGNSGLTVTLVARDEVPHGLGARLELQVEGAVVLRRVSCVTNPLSAAILPVHFGLGATAGPCTLTVRWPSGQLQRLNLPRPGAAYRVTEGRPDAELLPPGGRS